ncbi:hypothetical protein HF1_12400 [Mycoplasma haemofelis str. Langford 1]|uniref:Uncharacterized protein n=1 Tax=Mycoplasma haemofelis (strain Langford 1) TaxID=941640 RepID=E8ZJC7_MYCHL|nr:hypothetical protein [Mycoplasma haemofelis]CBY93248.1 hypothetical protein HF1_12400 [Mycoplasma haemofelis str. Langford 1]
MTTKVRMGLAGGLSSLVASSIGAYFGLQSNNDPVTEILNLQRASKKGRCRVRITSSTTLGSGREYKDFYQENGDKRKEIATSCLKKLPSVNMDREDVIVEVIKNSYGSYAVSRVVISEGSQ